MLFIDDNVFMMKLEKRLAVSKKPGGKRQNQNYLGKSTEYMECRLIIREKKIIKQLIWRAKY